MEKDEMSIQTAIDGLSARIQAAFAALEEKGADLPEQKTTRTLKTALEDMPVTPAEAYTKVKFQNGTEAFFELAGTLDASAVPGLSDAVEFQAGAEVTDIAAGTFSGCSQLTSVTIRGKTWQDAIDGGYWGVPDPSVIRGDWDRYLSFANVRENAGAAATVKMQKSEDADYLLPEISLLSSSNGEDWRPYDLTSTITLNSYGDRVFLKAAAQNTAFAAGADDSSQSIKSYWKFNLGNTYIAANGSVMSLLDGESELTSVSADFCFASLFRENSKLLKLPLLPAKALEGKCCYKSMFYKCNGISDATELPAEKLSLACYASMFSNCACLIRAPELPANDLERRCY